MMKDGVLREEVVVLSLNFCNFARLKFKFCDLCIQDKRKWRPLAVFWIYWMS